MFLAGSVYLPGDETGEDPADGAVIELRNLKTGEVLTTRTNYFGDWELENLPVNAEFEISVSYPEHRSVTLSAKTDTDHYVAELVLEKA